MINEQSVEEFSSILHDLNNIINTLNGYAELLIEASKQNSQDEVQLYKEKIVATVINKLPLAKSIAQRMQQLEI